MTYTFRRDLSMDAYTKFCFSWLCLAYCLPQRSDVIAEVFGETRARVAAMGAAS